MVERYQSDDRLMKQYARAGDNVRVVGLLSYSKSCEVINLKEKISV